MPLEQCGTGEQVEKLKQLVSCKSIVENRDELLSLFTSVVVRSPGSACSLFMRGIERLIKEKCHPEREICYLFSFLASSENPNTLLDVLTTELPLKYAKLQYFLRVYALRLLTADKEMRLEAETIATVAGDRAVGQLAAIDFILTRTHPDRALAGVLTELASQMQDKQEIAEDTRRGKSIERFRKSIAPVSIEIDSVLSHKSILANWDQLVNCKPEVIRNWISRLRSKVRSIHDKKALSNALINLGANFQNDPVVVEMWALSIELEASLALPSSAIFKKVWRMILAIKLHPQCSAESLVQGLDLCFAHMKMPKTAESLDDEQILEFSGILSALYQLNDWSSIVLVLQSDAVKYRRLIVWLLVVAAGMEKRSSRQRCIDILMEASSTFSTSTRIELESSYCSVSNACYDQVWLESTIETSNDDLLKNKAIATVAKATYLNDPSVAHHWCQKLTSSDISHKTILECGFLDLAAKLGLRAKYQKDIPIHQLRGATDTAKASGDALDFVIQLVNTWHILYRHGCIQDASRYLKAAASSSSRGFGRCSVWHQGVLKIWSLFANEVRMDTQRRADSEEPGDESPMPSAVLDNAILRFSEYWLECEEEGQKQDNIQRVIAFEVELKSLECIMEKDAVWSLMSDTTVADPPIVHVEPGRHTGQQIREQFVKCCRSAQTIAPISRWVKSLEIAGKIQWLYLVSDYIEPSLKPDLKELLDNFSPQRLRDCSIQSSRSFYNGESIASKSTFAIPEDTICLSLDFDRQGILTLTRRDKQHGDISLRLPCDRFSDSQHEIDDHTDIEEENTVLSADSAIAKIDSIIKRSAEVPPGNPKEFWEEQKALDTELNGTIAELQLSLFGGFLGLLRLPAESLTANSTLVERVKSILGLAMEFPMRRIRWNINPIYIAMLRFATEREKPKEFEDVVMSIFDAMKFQGIHVSLDETNLTALFKELKELFRTKAPAMKAGSCVQPEEPQRIMLICDRKATRIPWEMFPVFRDHCIVTRALTWSQVDEWWSSDPRSEDLATRYLVNPGNDLPLTHKVFIEDFKRRGWKGTSGLKPTEEDFQTLLQTSTNFMYVGHGSGKSYIKGSEIRSLYPSRPAVYLLGCDSVRTKGQFVDDDALTDYTVMGSSLIVGNLWAVKDKDFNRFCTEFLSRVFDEKQNIGMALREARDACVLRYLTGGAPVIYGLA